MEFCTLPPFVTVSALDRLLIADVNCGGVIVEHQNRGRRYHIDDFSASVFNTALTAPAELVMV